MFRFLKIENRMKYIYGGFLRKPVNPRAILFESFHGKEISDSPLAMAEAFLKRSDSADYDIYFSTDDMERDKQVIKKLSLQVRLVHIHSKAYAKALATCGYLVNNSSFPSYFIRREGQHYLQTWHGTPLKTLGKMMPHDIGTMYNVQHNFLQADRLMFPNEFTKEVIMRDYNLADLYTGKVALCGYPRNAVFSDAKAGVSVKKQLGDSEITTFAYMPTWRGQSNKDVERDEYIAEALEILRNLDEVLTDNQKLYVNFHPIVRKYIELDNYSHVFPFPDSVGKYEFLNSVDALITDYSSVFFDYSITGKPVILFMYDYDKYMADRGMYFDIRELPFIRVETIDELAQCIKSESFRECSYVQDFDYRDRFIKYDSIDTAERMLEFLFDGSCAAAPEQGVAAFSTQCAESPAQNASSIRIEDFARNREKTWRIAEYQDIYEPSQLDEIARRINPDRDIAVFYQNRFDKRLSQHMLANYKDAFTYVFTTKSNPMSYGEAIVNRYGSRYSETLDARNIMRWVGDLIIDGYAERAVSGRILKLAATGSTIKLKLRIPENVGEIKEMSLVYRSDMDHISYPFDYSITKKSGYTIIDGSLDIRDRNLDGVYWDLRIIAVSPAGERNVNIAFARGQRRKIFSRNIQAEADGYILFPHITQKGKLAFTHREKTRYDNGITKLKEFIAYCVYRGLKPYWRRRHIWLVFEKFCSMAQDNGYYFFRFCMDGLSKTKNRDIYYVMDEGAEEWNKVACYGKHVLKFMSLKHMIYNMAARVYVGSDSKKHLYVWRAKPNRVSYAMKNKKIFFLQHGVTALKRVDGIFGESGSSPMTHFTTTSRYEQKIVIDNFGYSVENAPITGFTRWDVLEDKSTPDEKIILLMPTWRSWLEEKTAEEFRDSDYFRHYSELLGSRQLKEVLEKEDTRLVFYIHPKFREYLGEFNLSGDRIKMIPFSQEPLNELMMKCSMLVTDYSSVCWDVYYQAKPVIFFQFDYDMYMSVHGSYMDMENDLFGDRVETAEELIDAIQEKIQSGFPEDEYAKSNRDRYFEYIDSDNSRRTYEYLKRMGY